MKAVVKAKPGVGIKLLDIPYPKLTPKSVILKTIACGICGADLEVYLGRTSKFQKLPMVLGHEFSGEIVEVGEEVEGFTEGEKVVVQPFTGMCGECYYCKTGQVWSCPSRKILGGMTEYVAVPSENLYSIPKTIDPEEAALFEPLAVAIHAIHISSFKILDTAVVLGPGPIGLMTLMALKAAGTGLVVVTGTKEDASPRLELAAKIGADATVNVNKENPVDLVMDATKGLGVDVVFDTTGNRKAGPQGIQMLKRNGKLVIIGHYPKAMELPDPSYNGYSIVGNVSYNWDTWEKMILYAERRHIDFKQLISHRLSLDEASKGFELARSKKSVKVLCLPQP